MRLLLTPGKSSAARSSSPARICCANRRWRCAIFAGAARDDFSRSDAEPESGDEVGAQIAETLERHTGLAGAALAARVIELLNAVAFRSGGGRTNIRSSCRAA